MVRDGCNVSQLLMLLSKPVVEIPRGTEKPIDSINRRTRIALRSLPNIKAGGGSLLQVDRV